jgi:hypothetical protein
VPIIKDGSIATGCGCCGGWSCFSSRCLGGCLDCPRQLVFTLSAPQVAGQPWVEPGGSFGGGFWGTLTKKESISLAEVNETLTVDISVFDTALRPTLPQGARLRLEYSGTCGIRASASQVAYTLKGTNMSSVAGPIGSLDWAAGDAVPAYANEQRSAQAFVEFSLASGMLVTYTKSWRGMGYAWSSGSNFPAEETREINSPQASPVQSCKQFPSGFSQAVSTTASGGGFPGPTFAGGSGFCLIPIWDGVTPAPAVGEQYGHMVGFVSGCSSPFYGNQIRVAGLDMTISVAVQ